jgi:hypothetical protein
MKRTLAPLTLLISLSLTAPALAQLPKSLDELKTRIAAEAKEPKAAAKLWFDAVFVYLTVDKELGAQMISEMGKDKEWKKNQRYFLKALEENPHIFRSYAVGATPENDYAMDPENYSLVFVREQDKPYADKPPNDYYKLFIASSGTSSPRPMTFQRNSRGEYKGYEIGAIYTGVRDPASTKAKKDDF